MLFPLHHSENRDFLNYKTQGTFKLQSYFQGSWGWGLCRENLRLISGDVYGNPMRLHVIHQKTERTMKCKL